MLALSPRGACLLGCQVPAGFTVKAERKLRGQEHSGPYFRDLSFACNLLRGAGGGWCLGGGSEFVQLSGVVGCVVTLHFQRQGVLSVARALLSLDWVTCSP